MTSQMNTGHNRHTQQRQQQDPVSLSPGPGKSLTCQYQLITTPRLLQSLTYSVNQLLR